METKRIFNLKLAQYLVSKGHIVLDIVNDKKNIGKKIFIFKRTKEFLNDLSEKTEELKIRKGEIL